MAEVNTPKRTDLAMRPSPVLMDAVLKVDQVVARLQKFQTTITRAHTSPVKVEQTWISRPNRIEMKNVGPLGRHDKQRRKSLIDYSSGHGVQFERQSDAKAEWTQWPSPADQALDVMFEIPMASQFSEQISEVFAKELQQVGPRKGREPADGIKEKERRFGKDTKGKDIAFPTKVLVQKTMSARACSSRPSSGFKVAGFPSDSTIKLFPPAKLHCGRDRPIKDKGKRSSGPASLHRRKVSSRSQVNPSSPNFLASRSLRSNAVSPELLRGKFLSPPSKSFRESANDADDELIGRRHSITVTEIRGPTKLWKLTQTEGMMLSSSLNFLSPSKFSEDRLTPVKTECTTGRRKSRRTLPCLNYPGLDDRELTKLRIKATSANSLLQPISKTTFKRESPTKVASKSLVLTKAMKREKKVRQAVMTRSLHQDKMAFVNEPQKSSTVTMLDLLLIKSPSHLPPSDQPSRKLMPLDVNTSVSSRPTVLDNSYTLSEDLQRRASHSHAHACAKADILRHKQGGPSSRSIHCNSFDHSTKENDQVPCVPIATTFLRNMSTVHNPDRSLSRKSPGFSLLHRAKVWVSSQAVKQGRALQLER